MPRNITTTVYTYDELTPKAQEKARDWLREATAGDTSYAEAVYAEAVTVAAMMGITINTDKDGSPRILWSGFSSQGDGASFEGSYKYKPRAWQAIREAYPEDQWLIGCAMDLDRAGSYFPRLCEGRSLTLRITQSGHYMHSHSMDFEFSEYGYEVTQTLKDALRRFADWIYRELEAAYMADNTDEAIADSMEANGWTFTASGVRFG